MMRHAEQPSTHALIQLRCANVLLLLSIAVEHRATASASCYLSMHVLLIIETNASKITWQMCNGVVGNLILKARFMRTTGYMMIMKHRATMTTSPFACPKHQIPHFECTVNCGEVSQAR